MAGGPVRVYVAADASEAHVVAAALSAAGVDARLFHERLAGALGELPHSYPEVWLVDPRDLPLARRVLDEYRAGDAAVAERRCPGCGEAGPGNFDVCWNCGEPLVP